MKYSIVNFNSKKIVVFLGRYLIVSVVITSKPKDFLSNIYFARRGNSFSSGRHIEKEDSRLP